MTTRITELAAPANPLGDYLRDRRGKLDPAAFGLNGARRRTPGLRREEIAQRAHISAAWYTSLEQGRGGAPSAEVLERLAQALMLTEVEREHLFLIGLGRPPEIRFSPPQGVSPRLQRVLEALQTSPALVKTTSWDVVAWNRAARLVLSDYPARPPEERNVLRMMFLDKRVRQAQVNWESTARFVVSVFRADVLRAGATKEVQPLVDEMLRASPEFASMWQANDVRRHGDGFKQLVHPELGVLNMEFSAFAVDGRPDLAMVVYNPVGERDVALIRTLLETRKLPGDQSPANTP